MNRFGKLDIFRNLLAEAFGKFSFEQAYGLFPAPGRAAGTVLNDNPLRCEIVAYAIRRRKILRLARRGAFGEEGLYRI